MLTFEAHDVLRQEIEFVTHFLFFHFLLTEKQTHSLQVERCASSACDSGVLELITQHNCISKTIQLWSLNILKYLVIHWQGSCRTPLHCRTLVVTLLSRLRRGSGAYGNISLVTSETRSWYFVRLPELPALLTHPQQSPLLAFSGRGCPQSGVWGSPCSCGGSGLGRARLPWWL